MTTRAIMKLWLLAILAVALGHFGPAYAQDHATAGPIQEARAAVSHAWEVYHRAALSGTLQSPALQLSIEKDLRAARALLAEADTANTSSTVGVSPEWLSRIRDLTDHIITRSQWSKP